MKYPLVHTLAFAAVLLLLIGCSSSDTHEADRTAPANLQTETAVPQSAASQPEVVFSLRDLDANVRESSEWIGKQPVVLNFWGTWCPPCRREIPDLVRVYNEFKPQGVEMLGITILQRETPDNVRKVAGQYGMNWPMLVAQESLLIKYRISGVPTTIFLDRQGQVRQVFVGPRGYREFKKAFQSIL